MSFEDQQKLVGKEYPPLPRYRLDRSKIAEFARATGVANPVHTDPVAARRAGYADLISPPTFPVVLQAGTMQQLLDDPEVDLDFSRVVHGEQSFTWRRHLIAGDLLTICGRIAAIRRLGEHRQIAFETRIFVAAESQPACTALSTLVVRPEQ